ncbi:MAG: hypothetical protein FWG89_03300 [Treponema sp.]|nr:hypothetical protein [Treponema sp.]
MNGILGKTGISWLILLATLTAGVLFTGCPNDPEMKVPPPPPVNKAGLGTRISEAEQRMDGVLPSLDGADVPTFLQWVLPPVYAALENALENGIDVFNDPAATSRTIAAAVMDIVDALDNFHPASGTSAIDKEALFLLILEVDVRLDQVRISENGQDVPQNHQWVTQAMYDELLAARDTALDVFNDTTADQYMVNQALIDLGTAADSFTPVNGYQFVPPVFALAQAVPADEYAISTTTIELHFDAEVSAGAGNPGNGFTISRRRATLPVTSAVIDGAVITFSMGINIIYEDDVTISYNAAAGSLVSFHNNSFPIVSFTDQPVDNRILHDKDIWITKAEVLTGASNQIQISFSEPVRIDNAAAFTIKVNDQPPVRIGNFGNNSAPLLDMAMTTRTVSSPVPVGGGPFADTWTLTMSGAARHGEIIRLAVTEEFSAVEEIGYPIKPMQEFIVKNLVPRGGFSSTTAGFYQDGTAVGAVAATPAGTLYQRAIDWLITNANSQANGRTYTIVLGENQTYDTAAPARAGTFTQAQFSNNVTVSGGQVLMPSAGFTIVLASADSNEKVITVSGNGSAMVIRNGITLIIEQNVAFTHTSATGSLNNAALIDVRDGGRLILDGGEIRGNRRDGNGAAGVAMWVDDGWEQSNQHGQGYFIMNSGKVTNNTLTMTGRHVNAGGIALFCMAYFVMHDGEVSNNTLTNGSSGTPVYTHGGGITGFGSIQNAEGSASQNRANMHAFYMTGGSVTGNAFTGNSGANPLVSAGGIMLSGTLQKTGGVIADNTNTYNQGTRRTNVAVQFGTRNGNTGDHWYRNADAGENVMLFTQGIKPGHHNSNSLGQITKPVFAPDNWEN